PERPGVFLMLGENAPSYLPVQVWWLDQRQGRHHR
ncbi:hypothetical protein D049_3952B, partial [Vibrio parahaemolyticus VPTS-2010]